ncbi:hypothetical protein [Baekduia sp.]|jgi:hypothetical protein|uniref:hypothetical protein n=1 Tax=Baekduia sp. TaxID=2600305 RepID=UPI002DFB69F9|nr:hypothetical protein [Baekduia sp.]
MPQPKKPIDVDQLTAEERDQLRRQLDGEHVDINAEERARMRQRALAGLMDPRDHLRSCPALAQDQPRVEAIGSTRPATATAPAEAVTIVRCITCGGQVKEAIREPVAAINARIAQQVAEQLRADNGTA